MPWALPNFVFSKAAMPAMPGVEAEVPLKIRIGVLWFWPVPVVTQLP